jgi:CubicO group peptidase (beta-lactamase class C family)
MGIIDGFTAPGFEAVSRAFEHNLTDRGEVGAAFAAYHDDQLVVDLWGGLADPATGRPWAADTVQLLFSGTKGLVAAVVLLLVERGLIDLDAPMARYWPEFGAAGKAAITVAEVMSHQARLPGLQAEVTREDALDHRAMAALLAAQASVDDPRAGFMYHSLSFGWLVGELVHRVAGRAIGEVFAAEFAEPLGLEVWIGLPDKHHHRAATTLAGPGLIPDPDAPAPEDPLRRLASSPFMADGAPAFWNSAAYRRAGVVAAGAHGTARAMARFYACLARGGELDGVRVLQESTVELGRRERRRGIEPLWGSPIAYATGFELQTPLAGFGPAADAFGHAGAGGSRHAAWPGQRVGFSYAMNQLRVPPDRRPLDLLDALHTAVRVMAVPR